MFGAIRRPVLLAIALLACIEIGLRWGVGLGQPPLVTLEPEVEYRLIPSQTYHRFGNEITINRYGMRAPDFAPTATADERRILLVGDSVIYGNHHIDQGQTIAMGMMAEARQDTRLAECQTLVMAAAASSWGPVNQAAYLSEIGLLDADVMLVVLSAHDLYDTPTHIPARIPYRLRASWGAIDDAAQILAERLRATVMSAPARAPRDDRQRQSIAALDHLHTMAQEAGIDLVPIYHPTVSERENGTDAAQQVFRDWATSRGVSFADLGALPLTPAMYEDDIHPAAGGAAAIAQALFRTASPLLSPCPI